MKRLMVLLAVVAVIVLSLAVPAYAEHNMEHVYEETERLKELYLPPGYGNELGQLRIYHPTTGEVFLSGLHGPMAYCQKYGGYWYEAEDGNLYWHSC